MRTRTGVLTLNLKIFHNPKCSKSRETLALLKSRGLEPQICEYLLNPPTALELREVLEMLAMQPRDLLRKKETAFRDYSLDDETLSDEVLIKVMIDNPILIERPIVVSNGRAAIGRPPEHVLEIL